VDDDDSGLYDAPSDFMTAMAITPGICSGQSILPVSDGGDSVRGFICQCSCGWLRQAATKDEGVHLAREHTDSI
jgi:hypothetical protein